MTSRKWKIAALGIVACSLSVSCNRLSMTGAYELVTRSDSPYNCDPGDIRSSHLVLHPDGSYDQVHQPVNGTVVRAFAKRWTYHKGILHLAEFRLISNGSLQLAENGSDADLKADPARPPIIFLPNSNCYYTGPK